MKKTAIIGGIIALIGVILFAVGLGQGGLKSIYWDNGFRVNHSETKTVKFKKINQIDVTASTSGPIIIKQGNTPEVKVHSTKASPVKASVAGNKLTISANRKSGFLVHGFSFEYTSDSSGYGNASVTVTVPKGMKLDTLSTDGDSSIIVKNVSVKTIQNDGDNDIDLSHMRLADTLNIQGSTSGDSDVTLNDVAAKGLKLDATDDVTIANSRFNAQDSQIQTDDGDITLHNNEWRSLTASSSDGDISFNQQKLGQTLKASTTDGDINGVVAPDKGVGIQTHVSDGDSTIFGHSGRSYGSAKATQTYVLSSTDGDITVNRN
ncbi:hypothetical protein AYR62_13190 [Secundilactobacillus paracollinoides]|uniref:DUF4097 domain-containing protein n=1 Tax=Secundilactobacillus paracollinoides TaxID=240427 RepID=A0A1B2IWN8_9LACO|nr:DUF4097 family beta strand repeat-containing protein [Secundilactobacillus paracollinoides]ANZ60557.1 hypothetical protein AYR61_03810 [Secundilactobacillus paracollinoides]ANZ64932.1 hypothetical protein AYR62_13190 [Secundilactobacillus paracollinoides]ANZ66450.1 hypothetical protein AYR63_04420 [Secundilactobacillus paracollinoides]